MTSSGARAVPFSYRDGVRASAPVAPMAFVFGLSFGVLAKASGMGALAPVVMSATVFGGSAQFAAASVLATGGGALGAIGAAVLLNARYAPISLTVAPVLGGPLLSRLLQSQLIVDESWAVSQVGGGRVDRRLIIGAGLTLYVGWLGGTALGVVGAGVVGNPARFGLDAAFPGTVPRAPRRAALEPPGTSRGRPRGDDRARAGAVQLPGCADHRGSGRVSRWATSMSPVWMVVAAVGAATVALKATGPVLFGGRELPPRLTGVVALLAPALLAALVAVQILGGDRQLVLDARLVGLAAAVAALALRAPILVVVSAAAVATALTRAAAF